MTWKERGIIKVVDTRGNIRIVLVTEACCKCLHVILIVVLSLACLFNTFEPQTCTMDAVPSRQFLWDVFTRIDRDRSGYITADELQVALSNGSWSPFNPETVRLMIGMFDRQSRGSINFEDFGALWRYVTDWQKCFRSFDRDSSGNIDRHELSNALRSFGYRLSDGLVGTLVKKFDRHGNGTILFDDFIQCCVVLYTLTHAFRAYDTDQDGVITIHYEQFLNMVFNLKI